MRPIQNFKIYKNINYFHFNLTTIKYHVIVIINNNFVLCIHFSPDSHFLSAWPYTHMYVRNTYIFVLVTKKKRKRNTTATKKNKKCCRILIFAFSRTLASSVLAVRAYDGDEYVVRAFFFISARIMNKRHQKRTSEFYG